MESPDTSAHETSPQNIRILRKTRASGLGRTGPRWLCDWTTSLDPPRDRIYPLSIEYRNIFRKHCKRGTSVPSHLQHQKNVPHLSPQPWNTWVLLKSSLSLIYTGHVTWFASNRALSGRQSLASPLATLSTASSHMGFLVFSQYFNASSVMSWETCSEDLPSRIQLISWYTPVPRTLMLFMSDKS